MTPESINNEDDDYFVEADGYDYSQTYELHPPTTGCFKLHFRTSDETGAETNVMNKIGFKFSTENGTETTLDAGCYMAKGAKCEFNICNEEELLIESFYESDAKKRNQDYWEFTLEDKDALDNVAAEYRNFDNCVVSPFVQMLTFFPFSFSILMSFHVIHIEKD